MLDELTAADVQPRPRLTFAAPTSPAIADYDVFDGEREVRRGCGSSDRQQVRPAYPTFAIADALAWATAAGSSFAA
jgi:hypothetical protein